MTKCLKKNIFWKRKQKKLIKTISKGIDCFEHRPKECQKHGLNRKTGLNTNKK